MVGTETSSANITSFPLSGDRAEEEIATGIILSGQISEKELRSVARKVRKGRVGPTSVYYAGVTAPAISAGMATLVAASLERAGWNPQALLMTSSIIAAMAGISWYLIFMRWSYRQDFGRGNELKATTEIHADELGVYWTRGALQTRIYWSGVEDIEYHARFIRIRVTDGDDVFLPKSWFGKTREKKAVYKRLCDMRDAAIEAAQEAA